MTNLNNDGKEVVCTFNKKMDTTECIKIEKDINDRVKNAKNIVFDLTDVEYIASSFLRICVKAAQGVEKGNFKIINAAASISKVFKISGLYDTLNIS